MRKVAHFGVAHVFDHYAQMVEYLRILTIDTISLTVLRLAGGTIPFISVPDAKQAFM